MTASSDASSDAEAPDAPSDELPRTVLAFGLIRGASLAGDGAWMIATTWLLVTESGPRVVGLFLAAMALTSTLLMTPASRVSDRLGVRRILLVSDAGSILVAVGTGAAWVMDVPRIPLLVTSSLLLAVVTSFYRPASSAFLQLLAPAERLSSALAIRQVSTSSGSILGSVLGGFLIAHGGFEAVISLNAATFSLAYIGIRRIPDPEARHTEPAGRGATNADSEDTPSLTRSLSHIWTDPIMRWTLLRAVFVNVLGMTLTGVILISRVKQAGYSSATLGLLEGATAVGLMVAGLAVARWKGPRKPGLMAGWAFVAAGILVTIEVALVSRTLSLVCALLLGVALVIGGAFGDSVMLNRVDRSRLVFFHAVMMTVSTVAVPLGQALGGIAMGLGDGLAVGLTFGLALTAATAGCLLVKPLRQAV